jgi:hypothetical protein
LPWGQHQPYLCAVLWGNQYSAAYMANNNWQRKC